VSDLDGAARAWVSVDGEAAGQAPFDCRDRYLASKDVADGTILEAAKFIFQQARNKWRGTWPPPKRAPESKAERHAKEWNQV